MRGWSTKGGASSAVDVDGELSSPGVLNNVQSAAQGARAKHLRDAAACFEQVATEVQDAYYLTDCNGYVEHVSCSEEDAWGVPFSPGEAWFHAIHEDDVDRVELARDRLLLEGRPFDEEYRIVRPDGSLRWVRDRAYFFSECQKVGGVARDVTHTRDTAERLMHAERMQVLGTMTS